MDPQAIKALGIIACVGVITQLLKLLLNSIHNRQYDRKYLWKMEDFPSLQSSVLSSILVIILLQEGISLLFVLTFICVGLLLYDSIVLRLQKKPTNNYLETIKKEIMEVFVRQKERDMKKYAHMGHTIPEVLAGVLIGVVVTMVFYIA